MMMPQLCLFAALSLLPLQNEWMDRARNSAFCAAAPQVGLKGWTFLRVTMSRVRGSVVSITFLDQGEHETQVEVDLLTSEVMKTTGTGRDSELPGILEAFATQHYLPPWFDVSRRPGYYAIDRSPDILGWDPPINIVRSKDGFVIKRW